MRIRRRGRGRQLAADSPLFGGPAAAPEDPGPAPAEHVESEFPGAEEPVGGGNGLDGARPGGFDPRADDYSLPPPVEDSSAPQGPDLRDLLPAPEEGRAVDDWGRSEHFVSLADPALNFYYRYWFRVETEGIEKIPSSGGALLVSNHSGALPPDAPMIMQAIRNEHPSPRPLYMLGDHWFKGYPGVGTIANKMGVVAAHADNAQRLLRDEGRLAIVFPEGQKGTRKLFWQRYRLRRFGRGGFVRTALRAGVPIVPIALIGGEEAMPIFAHWRLMQRATGLIYFPINHAFPQFGLAAGMMYMPAKMKIRFLDPIDLSEHPPETAEDPAEVQAIAEAVRTTIQLELDEMLGERQSVWFG